MIRLPTFQERAKIATPNKAGTLLGVSPFSSSRNVMAKVQDTSSFIEAARAIHGGRYDYSQTDYVGANQPITIVCRKHGAFTLGWAASHYTKKGSGCQKCSGCEVKVRDTESFIAQSRLIHGDQYDYSLAKFSGCKKPVVIKCKIHGEFVLAEAQSHYGKKQCGCKSCTTEKRKSGEIGPRKTVTCHCGFTGSRYEFKTGSKLCKVCHAKQRQEKYTVKCKGCDNRISTSLKKPYCSHECRNKHKPVQHQKLKVACCVCGTEVVRRVYGTQETFCCSLKCQHDWALIKNRGAGGIRPVDWIKRSEKAKSHWKKAQSKARKREDSNWVTRLCIKGSKDALEDTPSWVDRKCRSAFTGLNALLFKDQKLFVKKEIRIYSWNRFCKMQINRCYSKWNKAEVNWVRTKCLTTSGNWRRKLRG